MGRSFKAPFSMITFLSAAQRSVAHRARECEMVHVRQEPHPHEDAVLRQESS